jgi:hypothetical protein
MPERVAKEKETDAIFEEIMANNFPQINVRQQTTDPKFHHNKSVEN